ncbi:MAG: DUF5666 domain-containing protein, partial [bacterium]
GDKVEVKGVIESLGDDHIVVSATTFFVDENTIIKVDDNGALSLSDLEDGMFVEVHAKRQPDGSLLATKIEVESKKEGDKVEVKGVIESLGDDHIVVSATTFFVDENTTIEEDDNGTLSFADLTEGMFVKIHAKRQQDGSLLATKIKIEDSDNHDGEIEVKGVIESLGAGHFVVSGITFFVDENTTIKEDDNGTLSFSDLEEGMFVEVHAKPQPDGSLLATKIEVESKKEGDKIEVKGVIESLGDDHIVVSGITFFVDENTQFKKDGKDVIFFSDLKVGMFVKVHAWQQSDGSLLATKIEVEDDD